jgi:hypothetical protein
MTNKMYKRLYKRIYGRIDNYQAEKVSEILLFVVVITGLFAAVL